MRILLSSVLAAVLAQSAAQPQSPQPPVTFKVEVNYVEIDASVTDAQGNFVRTLTRDDFQIVEDGKPQSLTAFSMVDIPVTRPDPPLFAKAPIPPDVVSNRTPFEGRVFVLVLDDLNTRFERTARTRAAARQFVERYVGANDVVAVVNTSGYGKAMQDFTGNRALALRAIDAAMGAKADSAVSAALDDSFMSRGAPVTSNVNASFNEHMRYNNARNSLDTLRGLADYMAGMRGRRKAVVFFSEGMNYDMANPIGQRYATDLQRDLQALIASATRANVSYYTVDPRGVTSGMEDAIELTGFPVDGSISTTQLMDEMRNEHDSLRVIADETGGFAILNQNDFRNAFSRILEDNSSYYVLGYYPTNDKRDGRFRNVKVTVLKPGFTVRARRGYVAPATAKKDKDSTAKGTSTERTSPELLSALESPIGISGLTLSAFAAPFKGAGSTDAIVFSIEVDATTMKFAPKPDGRYANDLEVTLWAIDSKNGKVKDGSRDVVGVVLRPQVTEMRTPFRVLRKLQVPAGRYQLRIGAKETGGKVGTVLYELEAPDFSKGPITMSGLSLSSGASARIPTASPGGPLTDVLPSPPSAAREFERGDTLDLFAEVYDNLGAATAHRVVITTSVLSDEGKTVFTTTDERRSDELKDSKAGGGYGHTAKIPLTSLAPGRYVLRLAARPTLGKSDPISREVEFTVR